jgi:hypothetical protein
MTKQATPAALAAARLRQQQTEARLVAARLRQQATAKRLQAAWDADNRAQMRVERLAAQLAG